jgi:hypothetical protein
MVQETIYELIFMVIAIALPVGIAFDKIMNNPESQEIQRLQGIFTLKISLVLLMLSAVLELIANVF